MLRNSVAFIIALYAIGFAFAALAAVRWPTLIMLVALFGENASELSAQGRWRELGLIYGLVYLVAALFFYITANQISRRKSGAPISYLAGVAIGFPPFILFDFEPGWWQHPDVYEQTVLFGAVLSVFLLGAVLELNRMRKRSPQTTRPTEVPNHVAPQAAPPILLATPIQPQLPAAKSRPVRRVRKPVPAAILRQRQSFAHYGRKARLRQTK